MLSPRAKPYDFITQPAFHPGSLRRSHQRTHTGEKPYSCPHCDACFRDTASLKAHLRSHAGEKPYACRLCQASFVNLTTFTSHWRMHGAGDAQ